MNTPDYFNALKNYLDITWDDASTDTKLQGIAVRAEAYLQKAAGKQIIFSAEMEDQDVLQLLFDCCQYIRHQALDEFGVNYADELWALRANAHINAMEEAETNGAETL